MRHKLYEMIVAKAANMELVTLVKFGDEWMVSAPHETYVIITFDDRYEYFLCSPKHKETVLHSLNGGEIGHYDNGEWLEAYTLNCPGSGRKWVSTAWYMNETIDIRIKPKKVKRWLMVNVKDGSCTNHFAKPEWAQECVSKSNKRWQLIEIEIEV